MEKFYFSWPFFEQFLKKIHNTHRCKHSKHTSTHKHSTQSSAKETQREWETKEKDPSLETNQTTTTKNSQLSSFFLAFLAMCSRYRIIKIVQIDCFLCSRFLLNIPLLLHKTKKITESKSISVVFSVFCCSLYLSFYIVISYVYGV